MAFTDMLAAICIVVNGPRAFRPAAFAAICDCQYKTAFVLAHKLREAIAAEIEAGTPDGEVEIDGAYFGGHIRPANLKEDRVDRRLAEHQTGKRRVVVALRERGGRTFTQSPRRKPKASRSLSKTACGASMAIMHADEACHWDALHARWPVRRINHSVAYSDLNGISTNQAESYFSRLAAWCDGQHHHVSARATCTPMRIMRLGLRITGGCQMARCAIAPWAGDGPSGQPPVERAIGSGRPKRCDHRIELDGENRLFWNTVAATTPLLL